MEKYVFGGTLLVPMPKNNSSYTFSWIQTLNSANNSVNVIAFNTADPNKFQPMLKADLNQLMHMRRKGSREIGLLKRIGQSVDNNIKAMRNIKQQIRFIKQTLRMLNDSSYIKMPEQAMLNCTAEFLKRCPSPKEVIYLSWIAGMENN